MATPPTPREITRYGLDIGTNSIGWAVLSLLPQEQVKIKGMGVRIFSDGREPAADGRIGDPKNQRRRAMRSLRKNLERKKRRRQAMARFLTRAGYFPEDNTERKALKALDPYLLRDAAIKRTLTKEELARVLFNLSVHRGFKSNRKLDTIEKEDQKEVEGMKGNIKNLFSQLNGRTIGEYLFSRKQEGKILRFKPGETDIYPSREMYEAEFSLIKEKQKRDHPGFDWDQAYRIIFFQRPLKKAIKGKCTFFTAEDRAYRALPSSERFRIIQEVANLGFMDEKGATIFLTIEQKSILYMELCSKQKMTFDAIRRKLGISAIFNLEDPKRDYLKGAESISKLRKSMGPSWDKLSAETQDYIANALIEESDEEECRAALLALLKDAEAVDALLAIDLPVGVGAVSAKFARACCDIMLERDCGYDEAVLAMGLHHSKREEKEILGHLPYYGEVLPESTARKSPDAPEDRPEERYGRISNPTVHIVLNQLRKLINALIDKYGNPDEISIEVTRELKQSRASRIETERKQAQNKKKNDSIRTDIANILKQSGSFRLSALDKKRYLLWEELGSCNIGNCCLYCGKPIGAAQLFNGQAEIEHILPFSRTLDDSMANLTVAHKACNAKKGDRTPFDAFHNATGDYAWERIIERIKKLQTNKRSRFSENAMERYGKNGDFIQRQLTDTAYVSRISRDYLSVVCPLNKTWFVPGQLTSIFRAHWGFNTILNASKSEWMKNRSDHRHHSLDALVIGLTDRRMLQKAALENSTSFMKYGVHAPECPIDRKIVEDTLSGVLPSIRPDHRKSGQLLQETAYGKVLRIKTINTSDIKTREDVDKIVETRVKNELLLNPDIKKAIMELSTSKPLTRVYEEVFVARKKVTSLTDAEIMERSAIIDQKIRTSLLDFLKKKKLTDSNQDKKWLERVLTEFSERTGIKKVRYAYKNQDIEGMHSSDSSIKRWYQKSDVAFCDIWMKQEKNGKRKYEGIFINRIDWDPDCEYEISQRRPHPCAKKLMRLFKDDVIILQTEGEPIYCRIAGFSTTQNKLDIQPLFASGSIASWLQDTATQFTQSAWKPKDSQNHISINALFNSTEIKKMSISPAGDIRRKRL